MAGFASGGTSSSSDVSAGAGGDEASGSLAPVWVLGTSSAAFNGAGRESTGVAVTMGGGVEVDEDTDAISSGEAGRAFGGAGSEGSKPVIRVVLVLSEPAMIGDAAEFLPLSGSKLMSGLGDDGSGTGGEGDV